MRSIWETAARLWNLGSASGGHPVVRRSSCPFHRRHGLAAGFGLVEMMVSLSIVGLVMTAFMDSAAAARAVFRHQRCLTAAIAVGDQLTEELLLMDGSDSALDFGVHQRTLNREGQPAGAGDVYYTATWTVSNYAAVSGMRQLDLRVGWQEHGSPRYMAWTTFRS